jgi:carbon monoxide dehydrogenase subunit G
VKISGTQTLHMPPPQVYDLLHDPNVLARCMPGCESLEEIGPGEYAMKMKMVLASISGLFQGKVRTTEPNPPESFRLVVEGSGKIGFMKGDGVLRLAPVDSGTSVAFEGDVQVGGTIAAVGQRLIDTTAKMLIKKFFDRLATESAAPEAASGAGGVTHYPSADTIQRS